MSRIAALVFLTISLAGCDVVSTLTDGFKYKAAVEDDLQKATGIKPQVGFNWSNGRLVLVTVLFPKVVDEKPLRELAETVRHAVTTEFKQKPTISSWFSRSGMDQTRRHSCGRHRRPRIKRRS